MRSLLQLPVPSVKPMRLQAPEVPHAPEPLASMRLRSPEVLHSRPLVTPLRPQMPEVPHAPPPLGPTHLQAPEVPHAPALLALVSRNERQEAAARSWQKDWQKNWKQGTGAIGGHLLLAMFLVSLPPSQRGGSKAASGGMRAILIAAPAPVAAPPAPPAPPAPAPKPVPTIPKPAPAKKAITQAAPATPPTKSAQPVVATGGAGKPDVGKPVPDPNAEMNGLLTGIRNNWLRPPAMPPVFRCRVKVDYQAGGMVSAVTVLDKCGEQLLDDSIQRAIWKTQPLPWNAARGGSGSVILEFTP